MNTEGDLGTKQARKGYEKGMVWAWFGHVFSHPQDAQPPLPPALAPPEKTLFSATSQICQTNPPSASIRVHPRFHLLHYLPNEPNSSSASSAALRFFRFILGSTERTPNPQSEIRNPKSPKRTHPICVHPRASAVPPPPPRVTKRTHHPPARPLQTHRSEEHTSELQSQS